MGKTLEAEMLEVINLIENDSQVENPVMSPAEQAAVNAPKPRQRQDGTYIGEGKAKQRRVLTDQQIQFAQYIIRGKSQRAAYRAAYPNTSASDQSISTSASKLMKDPRIVKMIEDAADQSIDYMVEDANAARQWISRQLMISATLSKQEGSRLKALELLGRSLGMFQAQERESDKAVSADQLKRELAGHMTLLDDVTPKRKPTTVIASGAGSGDVNADGGEAGG